MAKRHRNVNRRPDRNRKGNAARRNETNQVGRGGGPHEDIPDTILPPGAPNSASALATGITMRDGMMTADTAPDEDAIEIFPSLDPF